MTAECAAAGLDRMQLLVTGAGGLTGRALCRDLADTAAVHAVSRQPKPSDAPADVCWHQADLSTAAFVDLLPPRIDAVAHLAQSSRFRDFPQGAPDVFAVNVRAVALLLDWATGSGCTHFVLASSGSVYSPSVGLLRESDPVYTERLTGFYAASKVASEVLAASYSNTMAVVALRPFFIYGARQEPSMLVPRLVRSVRDGVPVQLAGGTGFRFTPVHVIDAVSAVAAAVRLDRSAVVNVGGPEVLTLREACLAIGAAVGTEPVFEVVEERLGDLVPDLTLMRELLIAPSIAFDAGLQLL